MRYAPHEESQYSLQQLDEKRELPKTQWDELGALVQNVMSKTNTSIELNIFILELFC